MMRRWIVTIVALVGTIVAGFAWAISSPPGSSPDEDYHLASIWCPPPVESSGCKIQATADGKTAIIVNARVFSAPACYAFHPETASDCILQVPTTESPDLRYDRGEYPGGYYHVMHLFVSSDPYTTTYAIREVNVVIGALLGLLLVLAAAEPTKRIMAYAIASTYVPMGVFLVASINPSSWAVMGVTTAAFAFHSYWLAQTRGRVLANAGLAAVGVAMAASARTDSALFAALAALAILILHLGSVRRHPIRLVLPALAAVIALVVFKTSRQGSAALTGSGLGKASEPGSMSDLLNNFLDLPHLLFGNQGFWKLGWLDTAMPSLVYIPMIICCSFMLMQGMSQISALKGLVTIGGIIVLIALPLYILNASHLKVGQDLQARYLLPLLPVISLVLLTGAKPDQAVRLPKPVAWLTWCLVSGANAVALLANIDRYSSGVDGSIFPLQVVKWWMPGLPGPYKTLLAGSVGFAIVAFLVVRTSSDRPGAAQQEPDAEVAAPINRVGAPGSPQ